MFNLYFRIRAYQRTFGPAGLLLAVRTYLNAQPFEANVCPVGMQHPIRLRLNTTDYPTLKKVWREQEYAFSSCRSPKLIIDGGANIGIAAIFFATRFPEATIIAIEPEANNYALLETNVRFYPNIVPIRAALWNENGQIDVLDPGKGPWGFQTRSDGVNPVDKVTAITMEDILRRFGGSADILKIDIEGAEKELFEHCSNWIDRVGIIMIELHDRFRRGCSRAFYLATDQFTHEEHRGETLFVARSDYAPRKPERTANVSRV